MLASFLETYGYWAIFLGAMVEGESIILTASALAALGHLDIGYVGLFTFLGTLLADQFIYFLGVLYGPRMLSALCKKWPKIKNAIDTGLAFLKKNETIYILSFRFIYGIRIISPFIIGAQGISFQRFALLNVLSAFVWTGVSCGVGFCLGHFLGQFTENISLVIFSIVMLIVGSSVIMGKRRMKKQIKKNEKDEKHTPENVILSQKKDKNSDAD